MDVLTATSTARTAAEVVQVFNHHTFGTPSRDVVGWQDVTDVSAAVGSLEELVDRLPQVLYQLATALEASSGRASNGDGAMRLVMTAVRDLRAAGREVEPSAGRVATAHRAASHLTAAVW